MRVKKLEERVVLIPETEDEVFFISELAEALIDERQVEVYLEDGSSVYSVLDE